MTKQEIIADLSRPFSKEELRSRPGQGGSTFVYADASAVIARLNEVLGGDWDFEAELIQAQPAIIKGTLVVRFPDGTTARRVDYGYPNGERDQEPVKSAQSDALRRCARMIGVGLYLYSRTPNAKPAPRNGETKAATATPVADRARDKKDFKDGERLPKMMVDQIALMTSELFIDYDIDLVPKIKEALKKKGLTDILDLPYNDLVKWHKSVADRLAEIKATDNKQKAV